MLVVGNSEDAKLKKKKNNNDQSSRHSQPGDNYHRHMIAVNFKHCIIFHHVKTIICLAP